jgi:hypothetical protein
MRLTFAKYFYAILSVVSCPMTKQYGPPPPNGVQGFPWLKQPPTRREKMAETCAMVAFSLIVLNAALLGGLWGYLLATHQNRIPFPDWVLGVPTFIAFPILLVSVFLR